MTTIDRYVTKTFLAGYFMLLAVGIGLYIFCDVLFNLDEFTENRELTVVEVLWNMFDFYVYNLPLYYYQLGGVLMGIAASFTFAIMLKNNELIALVAAGMPLQRLAVPALLTSVVLVACWVMNAELIVPSVAHKIVRSHDDVTDTRSVEVHCVRDDHNRILSAAELRAQRGIMRGVYIIEPDETGELKYLLRADEARYDPNTGIWRLERGGRLRVEPAFAEGTLGEVMQWEPVDVYPFALSPEEILLRQSSEWAELMSIRNMTTLLKSGNLPNKPAIAKARHIRFTQPMLTWILLLLSVPFFLTCEPANVLINGGKALLLTGSCFAFTFIAHSIPMGTGGSLIATALPVLIFGPIAVLHLFNLRT